MIIKSNCLPLDHHSGVPHAFFSPPLFNVAMSPYQVVTAMGRTWHPEHFVCTHCQEEIGSKNFFERDGQPYCEKDYHNLFSPRCQYCNGPILDVSNAHQLKHPYIHIYCNILCLFIICKTLMVKK